jgi:hypothetical protein
MTEIKTEKYIDWAKSHIEASKLDTKDYSYMPKVGQVVKAKEHRDKGWVWDSKEEYKKELYLVCVGRYIESDEVMFLIAGGSDDMLFQTCPAQTCSEFVELLNQARKDTIGIAIPDISRHTLVLRNRELYKKARCKNTPLEIGKKKYPVNSLFFIKDIADGWWPQLSPANKLKYVGQSSGVPYYRVIEGGFRGLYQSGRADGSDVTPCSE